MLVGARVLMAVLVGAAFTAAAQAQQYPNRPVHILVGFAAGSGPDVLARAVAGQLGVDLGQNFLVENRPGANGTIATNTIAQSDPDGYTLLYTSDSIAPTRFVFKKLPYDVFRDLYPIATVGVLDGLLMLVNPASPAHTVDDFIDYAKKNRALSAMGFTSPPLCSTKRPAFRWSMCRSRAHPRPWRPCWAATSTLCL
jgi:tripartite-type tricarboxylate transporter receptor subunit TctC